MRDRRACHARFATARGNPFPCRPALRCIRKQALAIRNVRALIASASSAFCCSISSAGFVKSIGLIMYAR